MKEYVYFVAFTGTKKNEASITGNQELSSTEKFDNYPTINNAAKALQELHDLKSPAIITFFELLTEREKQESANEESEGI